jgi:hypothetical protein
MLLGRCCSLSCGRFARMVVLLELHAALGSTTLQQNGLPREIQNPVVLFSLLPAVAGPAKSGLPERADSGRAMSMDLGFRSAPAPAERTRFSRVRSATTSLSAVASRRRSWTSCEVGGPGCIVSQALLASVQAPCTSRPILNYMRPTDYAPRSAALQRGQIEAVATTLLGTSCLCILRALTHPQLQNPAKGAALVV